MNTQLFHDMWTIAPNPIRKAAKDFAKYPTDRNGAYTIGYLKGIHDAQLIPDDVYTYFLALFGQLENGVQIQQLVKESQA